jgi:hypothetical protein
VKFDQQHCVEREQHATDVDEEPLQFDFGPDPRVSTREPMPTKKMPVASTMWGGLITSAQIDDDHSSARQ